MIRESPPLSCARSRLPSRHIGGMSIDERILACVLNSTHVTPPDGLWHTSDPSGKMEVKSGRAARTRGGREVSFSFVFFFVFGCFHRVLCSLFAHGFPFLVLQRLLYSYNPIQSIMTSFVQAGEAPIIYVSYNLTGDHITY